MNDEKLRKKIIKYAKMLGEEQTIEHGLRRLEVIPMTFDLLKLTMVGKEVNGLSRRPQYAERAKNLVAKWRKMAEKTQKPPAVKSEPAVEEDSEGEEANSKSQQSLMVPANSARSPSSDASGGSEFNKHKQKRHVMLLEDDEEDDAFAAAMAASDRVATKRTRLQPSKKARHRQDRNEIVIDDIERSLAEFDASQPSTRYSSPAFSLKPDERSIASLDPSMFKPSRDKMRRPYAGKRKTTALTVVPKLYDICLRTCMNNIELTADCLPYVGYIPYKILKPVLEKCTHSQLQRIENKNQYLKEDTDELWQRHCQREFQNRCEVASDDEDSDEMWRDRFMRLTRERDARLAQLSRQINTNTALTLAPQKKAILADPIAPRDARRRQIKNGIVISAHRVPSAAELSRSRRQIFENGDNSDLRQLPKAVRNTTSSVGGKSASTSAVNFSNPSSSSTSSNGRPQPPKRGALMMKAMRMMKGRPR